MMMDPAHMLLHQILIGSTVAVILRNPETNTLSHTRATLFSDRLIDSLFLAELQDYVRFRERPDPLSPLRRR